MAFTLNLYSDGKFCKLEVGFESVAAAEEVMREEVARVPGYYTAATITRFGAPVANYNLKESPDDPE